MNVSSRCCKNVSLVQCQILTQELHILRNCEPFSSLFADRSEYHQYVLIRDVKSTRAALKRRDAAGVDPISQLSYSVYVNGALFVPGGFKLYHYADDTVLLSMPPNHPSAIDNFHLDSTEIVTWVRSNLITITSRKMKSGLVSQLYKCFFIHLFSYPLGVALCALQSSYVCRNGVG